MRQYTGEGGEQGRDACSPEGRASTKGNLRDQSTHRTQGRDGVSHGAGLPLGVLTRTYG